MNPVSIGDMAQLFMLRRNNAATSRELGDISADLARGTVADPGRHLHGHLSPLAAIESALASSSSFTISADQGVTRAAAMQAALGRIDESATTNATSLLRASQSSEPAQMATVARDVRFALDDAIAALNTRVSDQSLFSGTGSDRNALADSATLLAAAKAAIGPVSSPASAAAALDSWLAASSGFLAQSYLGTTDVSPIPIAHGQTVLLDVTAADPGLRGTLKGLILGSLMSEPEYSGHDAQVALARLAGETLVASASDRTVLSARLGATEARLAGAQSRHAAENLELQQARSDLIGVDTYDAAIRLEAAETRLEMIYTLTTRLSRLSLLDYMR